MKRVLISINSAQAILLKDVIKGWRRDPEFNKHMVVVLVMDDGAHVEFRFGDRSEVRNAES